MKPILLIQFLFYSILFFLQGCFEKSKNSITVPIKSEVISIDPQHAYDYVSNIVTLQMYETLYSYHYLKRPLTHEPLLAEDFPQSKDNGLTYTLKIRDNVLYHSEKNLPENLIVKASDFVNSFKRLAYKGTSSKGWWLIENKFLDLDHFRESTATIDELIDKKIDSVVALDNRTLLFRLKYPLSSQQLMNILSMSFTSPIPDEVFKTYQNDLSATDLGTGAYQLISFDPKVGAKLKSFDRYTHSKYPHTGDRAANDELLLSDANKPIPFISNLEYIVEKNENQLWKDFLAGKYSWIEFPRNKFNELIDDKGQLINEYANNYKLNVSSGMFIWYIEFNMKDPVVGNSKELRHAISYAINFDELLKTYTQNADQKANSLLPPGILGHSPSSELPYKYDPEMAKKILKKINWNPNTVLTFDTRKDTASLIAVSNFIKEELAKVGIKVVVVVNDFKTFLEKAKNKKMQFWQGGWLMDYPDAENLFQVFYSNKSKENGPNKTQFNNPRFDKLFENISQYQTLDDRLTQMEEMEKIIHEERPVIMLYFSKNYFLLHNDLKNFRISDFSLGMMKYLRWE